MHIRDSILCDISCYGAFSSSERDELIAVIGDMEVELASPGRRRYWACYLYVGQAGTIYLVSSPRLPRVLRADSLDEIIRLIKQQKGILQTTEIPVH